MVRSACTDQVNATYAAPARRAAHREVIPFAQWPAPYSWRGGLPQTRRGMLRPRAILPPCPRPWDGPLAIERGECDETRRASGRNARAQRETGPYRRRGRVPGAPRAARRPRGGSARAARITLLTTCARRSARPRSTLRPPLARDGTTWRLPPRICTRRAATGISRSGEVRPSRLRCGRAEPQGRHCLRPGQCRPG